VARLSDELVSGLRADWAAGGWSQQQLADKYGISRSYASRLVAGDRRPVVASVAGEVSKAVEAFLSGLELDDPGRVRAASAKALAFKLDSTAASSTAASALALPRLVDALASAVDVLAGDADRDAVSFARAMLQPILAGNGHR
jgi:transcriptional regulator with XRE-family HTH domain